MPQVVLSSKASAQTQVKTLEEIHSLVIAGGDLKGFEPTEDGFARCWSINCKSKDKDIPIQLPLNVKTSPLSALQISHLGLKRQQSRKKGISVVHGHIKCHLRASNTRKTVTKASATNPHRTFQETASINTGLSSSPHSHPQF